MAARFDSARLRPVTTSSVRARTCARSEALVAACRLGAGPATRLWAEPWGRVRIEWAFGVLQVEDLEVARRACLQLDGSWWMADAGAVGRVGIRLRTQWADKAWWRPLRPGDAWDAGIAPDPGALDGFVPRRATLIVIEGEPDAVGARAIDALGRQADTLRRALRIVVVSGAPGGARHIPA